MNTSSECKNFNSSRDSIRIKHSVIDSHIKLLHPQLSVPDLPKSFLVKIVFLVPEYNQPRITGLDASSPITAAIQRRTDNGWTDVAIGEGLKSARGIEKQLKLPPEQLSDRKARIHY